MKRVRYLPIALAAALLFSAFASAWHGADHVVADSHGELCAVCSLASQLDAGAASELPKPPAHPRYAEPAEAEGLATTFRFAANFLARGPPVPLA